MLGANLASIGIAVLFAAEPNPAFDVKNLEQILPYAIGGLFALGVLIVGLLMSRRNSAAAQPVPDGLADQLRPPIYNAPNQLWTLVVPSVMVLGIGAGIFLFVIPAFQEVSKAGEDFRSTIRANYETAIQSVLNSDVKPPMGPAVEFKPIQLPQQPQIQFPQFVPPPQFKALFVPLPPPPPRIPQFYIDRKGFTHSR